MTWQKLGPLPRRLSARMTRTDLRCPKDISSFNPWWQPSTGDYRPIRGERQQLLACGLGELLQRVAARYGAETSVLDWRERLVCSRSLHLAGDSAEHGAEIGAGQAERRNGCHRDQRRNQGILDSSDARLIVDEI